MKALYIISSPRGGSTLLSLALGRHSAIANLGEVSFIPKLLALHELCSCGEALDHCEQWQRVFQRLADTTGVDLPKAPYALHLDDAMKYKGGTGKIDFTYQTRRRMLRAKLRGAADSALLQLPMVIPGPVSLPSLRAGAKNTLALYQAASTAWQKEVVIDASKLPRKAIHLYQQAPDKLRILHLSRDSRGVCASRKSQMKPQAVAKRWNHYHSLSLNLLQRWVPAEHRMRLRYEDFVAEPERHLQALCTWLDLPYEQSLLDFKQVVEAHSAGGNPTRFAFSQGIKKADERWRKLLNKAELADIERINARLNSILGY